MANDPWEIIRNISAGKKIEDEEGYKPFLTNQFFSLFPDTLYFSNLMNMNYHLTNKHQIIFFINTVRPSKRYQKWLKKDDDSDYSLIREWYGFSDQKVKQALAVLTNEQIEMLKKKNNKGEP